MAVWTRATSSGWVIGQTPSESANVIEPPTISWNSGEHQKVCSLKLVSKAPARAASRASLRRSALV